jgi:hypothetical protein
LTKLFFFSILVQIVCKVFFSGSKSLALHIDAHHEILPHFEGMCGYKGLPFGFSRP